MTRRDAATIAQQQAAILKQVTKGPKFHNRKTTVDNLVFDSAKEARRYQELKLLQQAGKIRGLRLQESFDLRVNGVHIAKYRCDFSYFDRDPNVFAWTYEDVKGGQATVTQLYAVKRKLMLAVHGIRIKET